MLILSRGLARVVSFAQTPAADDSPARNASAAGCRFSPGTSRSKPFPRLHSGRSAARVGNRWSEETFAVANTAGCPPASAAECVGDLRSSPGATVRHARDDNHRLAIGARCLGSGGANSCRLLEVALVAGNGSIPPDSLPLPGRARSRLPPLRSLPGFADRAGAAIGDDWQEFLPETPQRFF